MASPTRAFAYFEWMIAARYLRAKRREGYVSVISIISLVGVALGVATLIIVMSVMNGFRHDLMSRMLGVNGHATVQSLSGPLTDYNAVAARVRAVPGVVRAAPTVDGQVLGTSSGLAQFVLVRGMSLHDLETLSTVSKSLSEGALEHFHGGDSVIIGARLAEKLRVEPGMQITLVAPRGNVTPFGVTPRVKSYTIAGTFNIGMSIYDQTIVFMPLEEAQLYFNLDHAVSSLEVMVRDPDNIDALAEPIMRAAGPYSRVVTWHELDSTFFDAVQVERNVMFMILTLIILVAALNIISGLIMLVKDKSGDIAILRTMGASRGMILRIFILSGASIGIVGTLAGFGLGIVITQNLEAIRQFIQNALHMELFAAEIYFFTRLPAVIVHHEVAAVVIMALALSFLATLYPSWRAARLDPVEGLRYE